MKRFGRRRFLIVTSALLAWPPAWAQNRLRRIGCLFGGSPKTHSQALDAFRLGLKEHGWVEGDNVSLEMFWAKARWIASHRLLWTSSDQSLT
jgi:hypothetical protein